MKSTIVRYSFFAILLAFFLLSGCSKGPSYEESLTAADAAYDQEDYDLARVSYLQCVSQDPSDIHVLKRLAAIQERDGILRDAYVYWSRVKELLPDDVDAAIGIARLARAIGDSSTAREEAFRALEQDPSRQQAIVIYADASMTPEQSSEALDWLSARESELSELPGYQRAIGNLVLRQGDVDGALVALHNAESLVEEGAGVFIDLANVYGIKGDVERADEYYQRAIEASDTNLMHKVRWARYRIDTDRAEAGVASLQAILDEYDEYIPAIGYLAQVRFGEGDYDAASALVERALENTPEFLFGQLLRERLKLVRGETQQAITGLQEMVTRYDNIPQVHYNLALAHLGNQDVESAVSSLSEAILLTKVYDEALLLRAELYNRLGSFEQAASDMAELLARRPDATQAMFIRAAALDGMELYDEAISIYQQFETQTAVENLSRIQFLRAGALRKKGAIDLARELYQTILTREPGFGAAVGRLVELEMSLENYDEGLGYVDRFLQREEAGLSDSVRAQYYLLKGLLLRGKGETEEALSIFKKVVEWAPEMQPAYSELATTYLDLGQLDKAIEELGSFVDSTETPGYSNLLQLGMFHELNKTYADAAAAYETLVAQYPDAVVPLNNLAYLFSEFLDDLTKAESYGRRAHAVALANGSRRSGIDYGLYTGDTLGWILFRQGKYSEASDMLRAVAQSEAATAEMKYHYGAVAYAMGDVEIAKQSITDAVDSGEEWSTRDQAQDYVQWLKAFDSIDIRVSLMTLWNSAAALQQLSLDSSLVDRLEARLDAFPNDVNALRLLARQSVAEGDQGAAASKIEEALSKNPGSALGLLDQAALQYYAGAWDEGYASASAARDLEFQSPSLDAALCLGAIEKGELDYASSLVRLVARDSEWGAFGGYLEGLIALLAGDVSKAVTLLDDVEIADPMVLGLGEAVSRLGSGLPLEASIELSPDVASRLVWRVLFAWSAEVSGDEDAALGTYQSLLKDYEQLGLVAKRVAHLYLRRGEQIDRAQELVLAAMDRLEEDPEVYTLMGLVGLKQSEWSRSLGFLQTAQSLGAETEDWKFALGVAQLRADASDSDAKTMLENALSENPSHWLAEESRVALAAAEEGL